jgi:signal transduction histidine kinase
MTVRLERQAARREFLAILPGNAMSRPMSSPQRSSFAKRLLRDLDPRHSLIAGIIWLVVALAASFALAASLWAGRVARDIVVQQHVRRLVLETDQLGSDLGQAVSARLQAIRASQDLGPPAQVFQRLLAAYPNLAWIAIADGEGTVIADNPAAHGKLKPGDKAADQPWVSQGLVAPWIGVIDDASTPGNAAPFGDFAAPLRNASGSVVAVIAARLNWTWASNDVQRLGNALDARAAAQTLILNRAGVVMVGPRAWRDQPWSGARLDEPPPMDLPGRPAAPRFERLPEGQIVLAVRAPATIQDDEVRDAWQVQLSEPRELVFQRANALAVRIVWISICLGLATAIAGALGARHLTNRLKDLTRSAAAVGGNEFARIEVPRGRDEVAQLAAAFAKILDDLRLERSELLLLSTELERRVAVRTREVERLAEESRYAAIVRERLQIARDLHDTLAHSMMAMLSEVRLLRKLQIHDPNSLAHELARAEEVAQAGLNEARTAITQMRANSVRDIGLGPALAKAVERFSDRTGLTVEFAADAAAARFGDERAEVIFRMSEEALRNVERHAAATHVRIALRSPDVARLDLEIADDGVGFHTAQLEPGHFGLIGLREQAKLIGAELEIDSAPNRGTTLRLTLRIAPEAL